MKLFRRILLILTGLMALLILGLVLLQPGLLRAWRINQSDFTKLSDRIYISPDTPEERADSLLLLISQAHQRNRIFWGEQKAEIPIIYCHTAECFQRYAAVRKAQIAPASFFYTPVFAYVLIGPYGLHSEVLAHELCHPELFVRTGWYQHEFKLPVWFFEGLAMQLDQREAYGEAQWLSLQNSQTPLPKLSELASVNCFFGGDPFVNYTLARHELGRWLDLVGKEGLYRLIEGLDEGKEFAQLYQNIENQSN